MSTQCQSIPHFKQLLVHTRASCSHSAKAFPTTSNFLFAQEHHVHTVPKHSPLQATFCSHKNIMFSQSHSIPLYKQLIVHTRTSCSHSDSIAHYKQFSVPTRTLCSHSGTAFPTSRNYLFTANLPNKTHIMIRARDTAIQHSPIRPNIFSHLPHHVSQK